MTALIASLAASFNYAPATNSPTLSVPYSIVNSHPNVISAFMRRDYDSGYFADDPTWFTGKSFITLNPTDVNIGDTLNSPVDVNYYSIQWTSYFVPQTSANYMFRTTSDDASYMWLGAEAISGYTTGNAIINNGGAHGDVTIESGKYALVTGQAYPIRFQYGEAGGGATMHAEFSTDNGTTWNSFSGYSSCITGGDGFLPYQAAYQLLDLDGSTYSGMGNIWQDTVSNKAFTLYNSPTSDPTNGGQIRFQSALSQWADTPTSFSALSSFSVQGVFKLHSLPGTDQYGQQLPQVITEYWPGGGTYINYSLGFVTNNTNLAGGYFVNGNGYWNNIAVTTAQINTWYDITLTYNGSTGQLIAYLNGALQNSGTMSAAPSTDGTGLRVARRWDAEQYLDSTIKTIRVWNGVLTPSEVAALHTPYSSLT